MTEQVLCGTNGNVSVLQLDVYYAASKNFILFPPCEMLFKSP
jgi:hypothetical protein